MKTQIVLQTKTFGLTKAEWTPAFRSTPESCVPMNDETALGAKLMYNSGEWLERRHRRRCGRAGSPADGDSVRQAGARA